MTTRVLIVESHNLLRKGLHSLISGMLNYQVVGEACDGKEAVQQALVLKPDLVLMDLALSALSGFEATCQIKRRLPNTRVVILTTHKNDDFVCEALRIGVDAYLLKGVSFEELAMAMNTVISGKRFICNELSVAFAEASALLSGGKRQQTPWERLSERERGILKLVAEGCTNRAAAAVMCVSPKTVEKHRATLMRKLGLHNAAELVLTALDMGLVDRESVLPHSGPITFNRRDSDRASGNDVAPDGSAPYRDLQAYAVLHA